VTTLIMMGRVCSKHMEMTIT